VEQELPLSLISGGRQFGEGLAHCRDINGETYEEEVAGPDVEAESNSELAGQAAKIRNESPEELRETITEMENDGY